MFKGGCVYIVTNARHTTLYTGVTANLIKRISEHRNHTIKGSFTDKYNLEKLIWYERHESIEAAINREKQIKRWNRQKKLLLINSMNPLWKDLWDSLFE